MNNSKFFIASSKSLLARFCPVGASLNYLSFDNIPLILSIEDTAEFSSAPLFFGKILAPVAGRITNVVNINNKEYILKEDEPGISLHSGNLDSLSFQDFNYKIINEEKETKIIFTKTFNPKPLPGEIDLTITYSLPLEEDELTIYFDATTNKDSLVSLSNHIYFNFNTFDINDYSLTINSSQVSHFYTKSKLIKGLKKVSEDFSFTEKSNLKDKLDVIEKKNKLLDHYYLFDEANSLIPQVTLENKQIKMEVYTSFEGCNVFVDSTKLPFHFSDDENTLTSTRRGIALECQNRNFPYSKILLKKGEEYHHFIKYRFYRKK